VSRDAHPIPYHSPPQRCTGLATIPASESRLCPQKLDLLESSDEDSGSDDDAAKAPAHNPIYQAVTGRSHDFAYVVCHRMRG
jgi:hypothetical protein